MSNQITKPFLQKLASGKASKREIELFNEWLATFDPEEYAAFLDDYQKIFQAYTWNEEPNEELWNKIENKIKLHEVPTRLLKHKRKKYWVSAAAVLLVLAISAYFLSEISNKSHTSLIAVHNQPVNNIVPGTNKAILKLEDGSSIVLEDASDEKIVQQSDLLVTRTKDGHLIYEVTASDKNKFAVTYNTIETPRGGEYQVTLPDGTKVWLNASSSLRFPTAFTGKERRVELTGEGYFEVAKNKDLPFIVSTGREIVQVLGTHFNISSYKDEKYSRTTLLEGQVKISLPNKDNKTEIASRILTPGQQSVVHSEKMEVIAIDAQEAVAWKNGEFMFNNEDIESVMRKIARWYDVEVIYPATLKNKYIWGSVSRFQDISEVLKIIELTGSVHFKVEGRRVYMN